ncbi:MAG: methyltransferase family protein [Microbacteriaceae bacterium]
MTVRLKGYLFVAAQFAVLGVIVVAPAGDLPWRGNPWTELVGQLLFLTGLLFVVWSGVVLGRSLTAHPEPTAGAELRTDGPFRFARHPIYSGLIALAVGSAFAAASWIHVVAAIALMTILASKSRFEESLLVERFGDEYRAYARSVGRFVPWFGRLG